MIAVKDGRWGGRGAGGPPPRSPVGNPTDDLEGGEGECRASGRTHRAVGGPGADNAVTALEFLHCCEGRGAEVASGACREVSAGDELLLERGDVCTREAEGERAHRRG